MKNYNDFVVEGAGVPDTAKQLKKKFRGVKDSPKKTTRSQLKGTKVGSIVIPKEKPEIVRDFLITLGYKVEEEFEGFIDMYSANFGAGATYKATIVSSDASNDLEVRLSTTVKGKSSNSFRKDTFSNQNAINQNKFSGKSPRFR
tara:strand:+ start:1146 stop:1577 length:432 start_codon:yes stop_codon:yes gene_type:complete